MKGKSRAVAYVVGLGAMLAALAGCETGPCTGDPLTDNLNCASRGIHSGDYRRRVDERNTEAADRQRQAQDARAENERLQARSSELQARIDNQSRQIDSLNAQLARAQANLSPGEAQLHRLQLDKMRRDQAALQQARGGDQRELQRKADALQREIDELKAALERRRA